MTMLGSSLIVLDTSVASLLWRGSAPVRYYRRQIQGKRPVISFQTWEESWFGALKGNWGDKRKNALRKHLGRFTVVWPNSELVEISAHLRNKRERIGRSLTTADAWIAATAIMLQCPLASHDRDFEDIPNLQLIRASNP